MRLKDNVAIVTGGGGGLGEGIALCLAGEGADVVVSDIKLDLAEKAAAKVKDLGRESLALESDVSKEDQVQSLVDMTIDNMGRIDILVCCAGVFGATHSKPDSDEPFLVENILVGDWDFIFDTNVKGVFLCNRAVAPVFRKQNSGRIVNISSVAGRKGNPILLAYSTSKAAVIAFSQGMALQMAPYHVNVNTVCPGIIYTPMWQEGSKLLAEYHPLFKGTGIKPKDALDAVVETQIPFKTYQTPEDIGKAVVFLVSDDAKEITGQALNVCGGMAFN
jgi:NAD(P)-dependent dehydrogenase (short-subunit alcohol dehydrogenase family)